MSDAKLSIHEAAAALHTELAAPPGVVTTMVDIDARKGEVIRVLVAPGYRHGDRIPTTYKGYPVVVVRQPSVYAFKVG